MLHQATVLRAAARTARALRSTLLRAGTAPAARAVATSVVDGNPLLSLACSASAQPRRLGLRMNYAKDAVY